MATAKKATKKKPAAPTVRGRPSLPEGERKDRMIRVMATAAQEEAMKEAAKRENRSLSSWLLLLGLKAAGLE